MFSSVSHRLCTWMSAVVSCFLLLTAGTVSGAEPEHPTQYQFGSIRIPAATGDEPIAPFSLANAVRYVDQGALAWSGKHKCVSCHTNGTYLQMRPA